MAGDSSGSTRELYETPTWAVALICAVMIIISLLLEMGLHHIGEVCVGIPYFRYYKIYAD
jgi:mlo protein